MLKKIKIKNKKKKTGKTKNWLFDGEGQFCPIHIFLVFSPIFSLFWKDWILVDSERIIEPHHFSLPFPLSTKYPSHSFSLLFFTFFSFSFFFILFNIHPTKHTLNIVDLICLFVLFSSSCVPISSAMVYGHKPII